MGTNALCILKCTSPKRWASIHNINGFIIYEEVFYKWNHEVGMFMVKSKKISMIENPKQSQSYSEIYVIAIAMENKFTSLCGIGSFLKRKIKL